MALCFVREFSLRVAAVQDVKSPNVLLAADYTAKISDVGLAKLQNKDYLSAQQQVGTFTWSVSAWDPDRADVHERVSVGRVSDAQMLPAWVQGIHGAAGSPCGIAACRHHAQPLDSCCCTSRHRLPKHILGMCSSMLGPLSPQAPGVPTGDWCMEKGDMQSG